MPIKLKVRATAKVPRNVKPYTRPGQGTREQAAVNRASTRRSRRPRGY